MKRVVGLGGVWLIVAATGCGPKGPIATVTLSHLVQPRQQLSEQHMQIAVLNANMGGDTAEYDQEKWSQMTADMMQYYLQRAAEQHNIPLKLVDREHVKLALGEKDLAAAGITDNPDEVAASRIQGASALLTSKVTVKIDKQVGKKRTVKAMDVFAHGWSRGGGGGGGVDTEEVDEESRNITVTCQFQLKDAATNKVEFSHNSFPSQTFERTKAGGFFGSSQTEADMAPRDQVIGGKIERAATEFLAKFVPIEVEATVQVKPSKHEMSVAGARALVMEDFETALQNFKAAVAENANDHASLFGAGVCCEKLDRLDDARRYYRQAQSLQTKEPAYAQAVARVEGVM